MLGRECTESTRLVISPCKKCGYPPKTFITLNPKRYQVVCFGCCESSSATRSRRVATLQWNLNQRPALDETAVRR